MITAGYLAKLNLSEDDFYQATPHAFKKQWGYVIDEELTNGRFVNKSGLLACAMYTNQKLTRILALPFGVSPPRDCNIGLYFNYEEETGYAPIGIIPWELETTIDPKTGYSVYKH